MHIVSEAKTLLPGQIMRELISNVDHRPASRWMPNPGMKMKRLLITQKKIKQLTVLETGMQAVGDAWGVTQVEATPAQNNDRGEPAGG